MLQQLKRQVRPLYRAARNQIDRLRLHRQIAQAGRPLRIVIGAGQFCPPGWIGTNIHQLNLLAPAGWRRYFASASVDAMLAEHVWEHLSPEEGLAAARTCFSYLRPGGYLRVAVPDGLHPDPAYIEHVRPGGSGPGADDHKALYTYRSIAELFAQAGFTVEQLEHFDEDGAFHAAPWDPEGGLIRRSLRFDQRNRGGRPAYTSLLIDAHKGPALS
jgi:predicted SAM-dependent methyltransferase